MHYTPDALLRCQEGSTIFCSLVAGLSGLNFEIHVDVKTFDALRPPPRSRSVGVVLTSKQPSSSRSADAADKFEREQRSASATADAEAKVLARKLRSPSTGVAALTDLAGFVRRRIASGANWRPARRVSDSKQSTNSRKTPAPRGALGISLSDAVNSYHVCFLAHQDSSLGVPNVILRCASLLYVVCSSERAAEACLTARAAVTRAASSANDPSTMAALEEIVDFAARLENMGNLGLAAIIDPELNFKSALGAIAAATQRELSASVDDDQAGLAGAAAMDPL